MVVDLPEPLEAALKLQASAHGLSPASYICGVLERELTPTLQKPLEIPFKTGRGSLRGYGRAPSAEEIDANRADIFADFGKEL